MPYPKDEAKLKQWESNRTFALARNPSLLNFYDPQILTVVSTYNRHLAGVAEYVPLNWEIVKAIAWVETGPDARGTAWSQAPMQIGNPRDLGLRDLLSSPNGKLILPREYAVMLNLSNVQTSGYLNIMAGTGYLLKIFALFGKVTSHSSSAIQSRPPAPGLSLHQEVKRRTTDPPDFDSLRETWPKSHLAIVGWRPMTLEYIAAHWNAGDGNYKDKLQFMLDKIRGGTA